MTERNKGLLMCVILLGVQAVVARAVFLASWCMERNWAATLDGAVLPRGTSAAINGGFAIPTMGAIACIAVLAAILRRRQIRVERWLLAIAVAEVLAISLFAVGITEPALFITYRLGK